MNGTPAFRSQSTKMYRWSCKNRGEWRFHQRRV